MNRDKKMKELTEKETKRTKTLFELGWPKREIARMILKSRVERDEGKMLEAIREAIPDRYKAAMGEGKGGPNSNAQEDGKDYQSKRL